MSLETAWRCQIGVVTVVLRNLLVQLITSLTAFHLKRLHAILSTFI
jgi:hypothetical protein